MVKKFNSHLPYYYLLLSMYPKFKFACTELFSLYLSEEASNKRRF